MLTVGTWFLIFPFSICIVTVVDSGSKALEYLGLSSDENEGVEIDHSHVREVGINLIITDYSMPGMTGYDLLRKIKVCIL